MKRTYYKINELDDEGFVTVFHKDIFKTIEDIKDFIGKHKIGKHEVIKVNSHDYFMVFYKIEDGKIVDAAHPYLNNIGHIDKGINQYPSNKIYFNCFRDRSIIVVEFFDDTIDIYNDEIIDKYARKLLENCIADHGYKETTFMSVELTKEDMDKVKQRG